MFYIFINELYEMQTMYKLFPNLFISHIVINFFFLFLFELYHTHEIKTKIFKYIHKFKIT